MKTKRIDWILLWLFVIAVNTMIANLQLSTLSSEVQLMRAQIKILCGETLQTKGMQWSAR